MNKITNLIIKSRESYMKRHYPGRSEITFREINITASDLFIYNVINRMSRYRINKFGYYNVQSTEQLCDSDMHLRITKDLADMFFNSGIKLPLRELSIITMPNYTWLYYAGRYYDIETPEGVINIFDLPLIRNCIINYINNKESIKLMSKNALETKQPIFISDKYQDIVYPSREYLDGYLYTLPTKEEYYNG